MADKHRNKYMSNTVSSKPPPTLVIPLDSLKIHQRLQVLNLPDLIVIEIQLPQGLQLLQVFNVLNQVLTETQSLIVEEKFKKRQENGDEGLHIMPFGLQTKKCEGFPIQFCWEFVGLLVACWVFVCLFFKYNLEVALSNML